MEDSWVGKKFFTHSYDTEQKTDLIIQVKPTIIQDNYSGIKNNIIIMMQKKNLKLKNGLFNK